MTKVIELWLHGRSPHTQRAYAADIARLAAGGKPLTAVTLADLQSFADSLDSRAPATRYRILSAVKSLLAFGHRIGYLPFDVGRVLRLPAMRSRLGERILPEADVHRMLSLEPNLRNRAILVQPRAVAEGLPGGLGEVRRERSDAARGRAAARSWGSRRFTVVFPPARPMCVLRWTKAIRLPGLAATHPS